MSFPVGAAATLVVAALVAIAAVVGGNFSDTDWKILLTLAAVERLIATLDAVDVLVTTTPAEGDVWIDSGATAPAEYLVLRRHTR